MADIEKYDQPTSKPTAKVSAAGVGGSISVVLIYMVKTVFNVEIPSEVAASIATVVSFLSGYFVRSEKVVL